MTARSIVVGYDGSPAAESAVRAAAALFPAARTVLATVQREPISPEQVDATARIAIPDEMIAGGIAALGRAAVEEAEATAAQGMRSAADAGLTAESRVVTADGSPWRAIRSLAHETGAEVVICGSRGLSPFSRAALGSTSSGLLHHADLPVLVVPTGAGELSGPVVIGFDGSESARRSVIQAADLLAGREVIVVYVWESTIRHSLSGRALTAVPVDEIKQITSDLDDYFRAASVAIALEGAELARKHGLNARPEAYEAAGSVWRGLLAAARARGAATVVAGSRGRGPTASTLLGSVSTGLVHNADLPVLIVPNAAAGNQ